MKLKDAYSLEEKLRQTSIQSSRSVVSDSLQPHGLQHTRPPYPPPIPGAYSNWSPSTGWYHPTVSSSVIPFSSCIQYFPASGSFSNESVLLTRWPKYWSFSFRVRPSSKYSGLISFRIDWLHLLAVQGTQEFSLAPQLKSINSSALSFLYGPILTFLCWQRSV